MTQSENTEVGGRAPPESGLDQVIEGRGQSVSGFMVRRVLQSRHRRRIGPWTFLDHLGPIVLGEDQPLRVPPHPHLNLATVTYLFSGELVHKDSLGSRQTIEPGAINWMNAGRGVVHSECSPFPLTMRARQLHGLQLWLALPQEREESDPWFQHYSASQLPTVPFEKGQLRLLVGEAFGAVSPVRVDSPTLLVDVELGKGARLPLPSVAELAAYVVSGRVQFDRDVGETGRLLVFMDGASGELRAMAPSRVVLIGGAPLDGERHMFWNFVSSSLERLEIAKAEWELGPRPGSRFPPVVDDSDEFVPLPS